MAVLPQIELLIGSCIHARQPGQIPGNDSVQPHAVRAAFCLAGCHHGLVARSRPLRLSPVQRLAFGGHSDLHGGRTKRRHGFQSLGRSYHRCRQSPHPEPAPAGGPAVCRRGAGFRFYHQRCIRPGYPGLLAKHRAAGSVADRPADFYSPTVTPNDLPLWPTTGSG